MRCAGASTASRAGPISSPGTPVSQAPRTAVGASRYPTDDAGAAPASGCGRSKPALTARRRRGRDHLFPSQGDAPRGGSRARVPGARGYFSPATTTLLSVAPWEQSEVSTRSGYLGILPEE